MKLLSSETPLKVTNFPDREKTVLCIFPFRSLKPRERFATQH